MKRYACLLVGATLIAIGSGCGKSGDSGPPLAADSASPSAAVSTFLEACRRGSDKDATRMLTPLARQKNEEASIIATPPGSATATFAVGDTEFVTPEKDGAHVAASWSDVDSQGQQTVERFVWVLRKETEGWRIAGMAVPVFEGEPPLILNFEDPEDTLRKQKLLAEEMARRSAPPTEEARRPMPGEPETLK